MIDARYAPMAIARLDVKSVRKARRLTPWDRLMLRWSVSKRIDGLWVGTLEEGSKAETVLHRVEEALCLIRTYDRRRYDRLRRDLERVWILVLVGALGSYNDRLRACELDPRHVLTEDSSPEIIAATIVHEATHARLLRCGLGYDEGRRSRIEAVCFRREIAFAAKLPDGERVRDRAERQLTRCTTNEYWTDVAFDARLLDDAREALRHLDAPKWFARAVPVFLAIRRGLSRYRRR
jgi:hypothetical protein